MTPRPIYRWKSFWLGIILLAFLGWAWGRSMSRMDIVGWVYRGGTQGVFARSLGGLVELQVSGPHYSISPVTPMFQVYTYPHKPPAGWFPGAVTCQPFGAHGGWTVTVAHWLLILLYLVPSSAFLAWRWRRMKSPALRTATSP
ncbi:hypothetical protein OKA05_27855 [Luteolibacter arcticus]|uniref:DUF3592 domain-containing protein n=1 Tax=Luteolibacter arcticus TaxID=1581411 RepID=A0ABT3GS93_9BACT|nr:hypothetical protein [Luteolibacter arcticus]MCW1926398.1 hypothetical protein [Luteolibacter arcticus]